MPFLSAIVAPYLVYTFSQSKSTPARQPSATPGTNSRCYRIPSRRQPPAHHYLPIYKIGVPNPNARVMRVHHSLAPFTALLAGSQATNPKVCAPSLLERVYPQCTSPFLPSFKLWTGCKHKGSAKIKYRSRLVGSLITNLGMDMTACLTFRDLALC